MQDREFMIALPGKEPRSYNEQQFNSEEMKSWLKDHPNASVAERHPYVADDDDIRDTDQYTVALPGKSPRAYTKDQMNSDAMRSWLADHPKAAVSKWRKYDYWADQNVKPEKDDAVYQVTDADGSQHLVTAQEYHANRAQYTPTQSRSVTRMTTDELGKQYSTDPDFMAHVDHLRNMQELQDFMAKNGEMLSDWAKKEEEDKAYRTAPMEGYRFSEKYPGITKDNMDEIKAERDRLVSQRNANPYYQKLITKDIDDAKSLIAEVDEAAHPVNPIRDQLRGTPRPDVWAAFKQRKQTKSTADRQAQTLAEKAVKTLEAPDKNSDKENPFMNFAKGGANILSDPDFWTRGVTAIINNNEVSRTVDAIRKKIGGRELTIQDLENPEDIKDLLSQDEVRFIKGLALKVNADFNRALDTSNMYQAGQTAAESLGFMLEFLATGAIAKSIGGGIAYARGLVNEPIGGLTGAFNKWSSASRAAMSARGASATSQAFAQGGIRLAEATTTPLLSSAARMWFMPSTYKNLSDAAAYDINYANGKLQKGDVTWKDILDQGVEVWSETALEPMFALAGKSLGYLGKGTKVGRWLKEQPLGNFLRLAHDDDFVKFMREAGFNGYGEEILEEVLGAGTRQVLGIDDKAWDQFLDKEQLGQMAVAFLPMSLVGAFGVGANIKRANRIFDEEKNYISDFLQRGGMSASDAQNLLNRESNTMDDIANKINDVVRAAKESGTLTEEDKMHLIRFAAAQSQKDLFEAIQQAEGEQKSEEVIKQTEEAVGGRFWQEKPAEDGQPATREVETIEYADGRRLFVTAKDEQGYACVDEQGHRITLSNEELSQQEADGLVTGHKISSMSEFASNEREARRAAEEQQRLAQDDNQFLQAVKDKVAEDMSIPVTIDGQQDTLPVIDANDEGVTVVLDEKGTLQNYTWEQVAEALGMPLHGTTDADIQAARDDAEVRMMDVIAGLNKMRGTRFTYNGASYNIADVYENLPDGEGNPRDSVTIVTEQGDQLEIPNADAVAIFESLQSQEQSIVDSEKANAPVSENVEDNGGTPPPGAAGALEVDYDRVKQMMSDELGKGATAEDVAAKYKAMPGVAPAKVDELLEEIAKENAPAVPTDEKGAKLYTQAPVELTYADIYGNPAFESKEEADSFVSGKAKRAKEAADKAQKKVDKIKAENYDSPEQFREAKDKAKAELQPLLDEYNYWEGVKEFAKNQQQAPAAVAEEAPAEAPQVAAVEPQAEDNTQEVNTPAVSAETPQSAAAAAEEPAAQAVEEAPVQTEAPAAEQVQTPAAAEATAQETTEEQPEVQVAPTAEETTQQEPEAAPAPVSETSSTEETPAPVEEAAETPAEEAEPAEQPVAQSGDERLQEAASLLNNYAQASDEANRAWQEWLHSSNDDAQARRNKWQGIVDETRAKLLQMAKTFTPEDMDKLDGMVNHIPGTRKMINEMLASIEEDARKCRVSAFIQQEQKTIPTKAKPVGKINLYASAGNNEYQPALRGVYHDKDGYAVVTNAHILLADAEQYDKKKGGKIIGKDGKEIKQTFPDWKSLFDKKHREGEKTAKMDFGKLRDFIASVKAQREAEWQAKKDAGQKVESKKDYVDSGIILLNLGDNTVIGFKLEFLPQLADFAEKIGAEELRYIDSRKPIVVQTKKGVGLLMPVMEDFKIPYETATERELAKEMVERGRFSYGQNEYQKNAAAAEKAAAQKENSEKAQAYLAGETPEELAARKEEERRAPIREQIKQWQDRTGVNVEILEKPEDVVNQQARAEIEKGEQGAKPAAWYLKSSNTVFFYMPNITDAAHADRLFLHEVISHKGLRELLGEEKFNELMDSVWNDLMDDAARAEWLDYVSYLNGSEEQMRRAAADEFVAHMAENLDTEGNESLWDKFVDMVHEILKKIGIDIKLTKADLQNLLRASLANYERSQAEVRQQALAEQERKAEAQALAEGERTKATDTAAAANNPQVAISGAQEKYDDFGQKIGMARKDIAVTPQKRGNADDRPAWMKKYDTMNVEMLTESQQDVMNRFGAAGRNFREVVDDITKGTNFEKPFVGFWVEEKKTYYGVRKIKHYITGENYQPIIFTSKDQYDATLPVFEAKEQKYRVGQKGNKWIIYRYASNKKAVEYAEFDTKEDAAAYLASPEGATSLLNRKRENFELPALTELTRVGMPDYRNGRNITPDDLMKTFGFRGGEFGNWLNADERQQFLNYAYDALMDLACILNVTPRALTLNGELSIAFGARGRQGAAAHYEPDRAVINLTKMHGAGSLAHEWGHALDNYFGLMDANRQRIREKGKGIAQDWNLRYLSEGTSYSRGVRREVVDAFNNVMSTLKTKEVTRAIEEEKTQKQIDDFRRYADRNLNDYIERYQRGRRTMKYNRSTKKYDETTYKFTDEQVEQLRSLVAQLDTDKTFKWQYDFGKGGFRAEGDVATKIYDLIADVAPNKKESMGPLNDFFYYYSRVYNLLPRLEAAKRGESETVKTDTKLYADSKWFDKDRAGSYYSSDKEMFARGIEAFVMATMREQGQTSDYLTYDKGSLYQHIWEHSPYAIWDELTPVKEAYRALFDAIQEKTDEGTGNQVLFSKQVYHGTGADFEKFDHSHMGEGEGNQAFGWGTYVAEKPDVAKEYAVHFGEPGSRHLYTVNIPEDNGENYLHWNRPVTYRQANAIMAEVRKRLGDEAYEVWGDEFDRELKSVLGYGTYGSNVEGGLDYFLGNEYDYATDENPGAKRNAELLNSIGIVGIEVPMGEIRDNEERGTDYVIFNENDLEITDNILFSKAQQAQKKVGAQYPTAAELEDDLVLFSLSKNNRATINAWMNKRQDLTEEQKNSVIEYLDTLNNPKLQLATAKWFAQGKIRLPEDMSKVEQAVSVAGKAKVDPLQYNSPMELLEAHADFKPSEKRINPDEVSTLHRAKEYPEHGIVTYDVDESEESRKNMREIINTHYGKEASPWCLLQGDGNGNLTEQSKTYWGMYNAYPKQVAFKDGKLLAFSANSEDEVSWWDRQDEPHNGIPYGFMPIDGDELGRGIMSVIGEDGNIQPEKGALLIKGNKQDGEYMEWLPDTKVLVTADHYKNGRLDGVSEAYFANGELEHRANYKDGRKDGIYESYNSNGNLSVMATFKNGDPDGYYDSYWEDGTLMTHREYKDGFVDGTVVDYYPNGQVRSTKEFADGDRYGEVKEYAENGQILSQRTYHGLREVGESTKWHHDGSIASIERHNEKGKPDGIQEYYDYVDYKGNSSLSLRLVYENGVLREHIGYSQDGSVSMEQHYDENGEMDGIQRVYYKEGGIRSSKEYSHGEFVRDLIVNGIPNFDEEGDIRFSKRTKPGPQKTKTAYKLMRLGNDGKLYTLFIDSAEPQELHQWYDAESPDLSMLKKMPAGVFLVNYEDGTYQYLEDYAEEHGFTAKKFPPKSAIDEATANGLRWVYIEDTDKKQRRYEGDTRKYYNLGINGAGSVGTYAMRPGFHAGTLPTMRQIGKGAEKNLRDDSFVWVKGSIPADINYQEEADRNPDKDIPTHIPTDGYYLKATNADKKKSQADRVGWYVAGSFRPDRILGDQEARDIIDRWNAIHYNDTPVEYDYPRESGRTFNAETMQLEGGDEDIRFGKQVAADLYDRYANQDGEEKPWMSEGDLIDEIEKKIPYGVDSENLFSLIDRYRRLDEQDFEEGRRDFAGGEKEDLFDEILEALRNYAMQELSDEIRFSKANRNQEIFVSNAEKAVEGIQMEKATPEQWLKMLEKNGGLKAGEDKWLGLSDWLKASEAKSLTKEEVLAFIDQNKIQIEEQHYSGDPQDRLEEEYRERIVNGNSLEQLQGQIDQELNLAGDELEGMDQTEVDAWLMEQMKDRYGDDFELGYSIADGRVEYNSDVWSVKDWEETAGRELEERPINSTRLSYTTDGLGNNREIALTVPTIQPYNASDNIHFGDAGEGRAIAWVRFGDTNRIADAGSRQRSIDARVSVEAYIADHPYNLTADEKAELAELKKKRDEAIAEEAEDAATLFIDEIQSKRHQDAREKGYLDLSILEKARKATEAMNDKIEEQSNLVADLDAKYGGSKAWTKREEYGIVSGGKNYRLVANPDVLTEEEYKAYTDNKKEIEDLREQQENLKIQYFRSGQVPAAPFEKNWMELAFKRMLRLAAEENYDYVAWTTGDQQTDRYNLANTISEIDVNIPKNSDERIVNLHYNTHGEGGNYYNLLLDKDGNIVHGNFAGQNIGQVVGKEMAVKIMGAESNMTISGDGLKVGGEGMKGFYDEMLPRFVNKYCKKWGVQVSDKEFPDLNGGITAHTIPVTQEMKDSVMEGQVMFSKKRPRGWSSTDERMLKEQSNQQPLQDDRIKRSAITENFYVVYDNSIREDGPYAHDINEINIIFAEKIKDRKQLFDLLKEYDYDSFADENALNAAVEELRGREDDSSGNSNYALQQREGTAGDDTLFSKQQADTGGGVGQGGDATEEYPERGTARGVSRRVSDTIADARQQVEETEAAATQTLQEQMRAVGARLSDLRKAASAQREYDRETVKAVTDLAKRMIEEKLLSDLNTSEVKKLLAVTRNSVGKKHLNAAVDAIVDIITNNQLRQQKNALRDILALKATKINNSGIEVGGKLDIIGQAVLKTFKRYMSSVAVTSEGLDTAAIDEAIADAEERLTSEDKTIADNAAAELAALRLAKYYGEEIGASEQEEHDLRQELIRMRERKRSGQMAAGSYAEAVAEVEDAIRQNNADRIEAYDRVITKLAETMAGSRERLDARAEAEKARVEEIHHFANSDMSGTPSNEHGRKNDRFTNNNILRFLNGPLATFEQMLKAFGRKSARGEGYLYNKFMRGWVDARENEITGIRSARKAMDAKVQEVFGKKGMRWSDLYSVERKMPTVNVEWWDGGQMRDHELTQGNLLYIYMVNKMSDGRMKLRAMGISQEDVDAIEKQMDPRFLALADWLQNEFLVDRRNKYNEVYERMFGAPMAAIENYFPLRINPGSRVRDLDVAEEEHDTKPGTITGSIIKRRRNAKALDILGSDAFSVAASHIDEMEHWAAFAEYNRDLNTLLSYKHFRNQVENLSSILYGAGSTIWRNFKKSAEIAVGAYQPAGKKSDLDRAAVNIAKGVSTAKISFRLFTAIKQLLSMPAYLPDANVLRLGWNMITPWNAWKWSMENLPIFRERFEGRLAGDTRLMNTDSDWKLWKNNFVKLASRWGLSPNAFVDALTVAIGAKSMYDTKKAGYTAKGYSEEEADKRAKQDATILYNESQQSTEGAFLSAMQLDRTWAATATTVFRNSSMGYERQMIDAVRNIGHRMTPGYRKASIEYMTKQMVRDGIPEEDAAKAAERIYNKAIFRDSLRVAIFGYVMQFAWNLGSYLPYLFFGDDDDKKKEMLQDAARHGIFGGVEGLSGGNIISDISNILATPGKGFKDIPSSEFTLMPIASDIQRLVKLMGQDMVAAGSELLNLGVQTMIGVNPQTFTDMVVAIYDACHGDLDATKETMMLIMRIMQVPQSQLDQLMIDELGIKAGEAMELEPEELAKRYADYRVKRGAPLTGWTYSDEEKEKQIKKNEKRFNDLIKDRKKLKRTDAEKAYDQWLEDIYKPVKKNIKGLLKTARDEDANGDYIDPTEKARLINEFRHSDEYRNYLRLQGRKKTIDKVAKRLKEAEGDSRIELEKQLLRLKEEFVEELNKNQK